MPKAFSYIRFSLARQSQGDSLRRQSALAEEWSEENGIPLVENYQDLGVSGYRGKNADEGALRAFLDAIESGKVVRGDILLVESLDRMGRQQVNRAMALLLQVINSGVTVVTLGEDRREYREDSPNIMVDLIMSLISMSRAHEESAMKSQRNREAWKQKRIEGIKSGRPMSKRCPSWLEVVDGEFHIIESKAAIIRMIYDASAAGRNVNEITRDLNSREVPSLRLGRPWSPSTIAYLLDTRSVLGEFTPKTKEPDGTQRKLTTIRDYFPRIIDDDLFLDAQRNRGMANHNRGASSRNAFRGLIKSPAGYPIQMKISTPVPGGTRYVYLRYGAADRGVESHRMWAYQEFVDEFLAALKDHIKSPRKGTGIDPGKIDELEALIAASQLRLDNLAESIANGYSKALDDALRKEEVRLVELKEEIASARRVIDECDAELDPSNPDQLRLAVRQVVRSITMDIDHKKWEAELLDGEMITSRPENKPKDSS